MNKVLVIGNGGREHALAWKFSQSPLVEKVYIAPGNPGMESVGQCIDIAVSDFPALAAFAKKKDITLTFVGPEAPLVDGIADYFEGEGLTVFGPRANAAIIEGSKSFAKQLMKKYGIPSAAYEVFSSFQAACAYVKTRKPPYVLKADGLAAGKGVVIAETAPDACSVLEDMLQNKIFGEAGNTVVIEEFLEGTEFSYMAFVNGENVYPMEIAKDHKRAFDNDKGPNTGGMGAYSPVPQISSEMLEAARNGILLPTAKAMVKEGRPFTGVLYAGLIATKAGAKVIEFNARFGDPETEVIIPRLENDLYRVLTDVLNGQDPHLKWSDEKAIGVVLASKGYPGDYKTGYAVNGLDKLADAAVFHCGTGKNEKGDLVTNGGRVLLAACMGETFADARRALYKDINKIKCENLFYRNDIGVSL